MRNSWYLTYYDLEKYHIHFIDLPQYKILRDNYNRFFKFLETGNKTNKINHWKIRFR